MTRKFLVSSLAASVVCAMSATAQAQSARDSINIVGSSTVYPFTTTVAEQFGRGGQVQDPQGREHRHRRRHQAVLQRRRPAVPGHRQCLAPHPACGAADLRAERRQGRRRDQGGLRRHRARAEQGRHVAEPDAQGCVPGARQERSRIRRTRATLIPNPYTTWKDVNKSLPAMKIEVLGPPPTSGTRDSFAELYMEAGCRTFAWLDALRYAG